ncbi:hypothetical protein ABPG75_000497 [Micractinium tetrahymenae]
MCCMDHGPACSLTCMRDAVRMQRSAARKPTPGRPTYIGSDRSRGITALLALLLALGQSGGLGIGEAAATSASATTTASGAGKGRGGGLAGIGGAAAARSKGGAEGVGPAVEQPAPCREERSTGEARRCSCLVC